MDPGHEKKSAFGRWLVFALVMAILLAFVKTLLKKHGI
jgi:hypothetical protein